MKKILFILIILIAMLTSAAAQQFPITNYHYYRVTNGVSPAVAATGGINLTNADFPSTSYYNPAVLAFRRKSTITTAFRLYNEKTTILNELQLPENDSFEWHKENFAYIGIEAENVAFNYFNLARINYHTAATDTLHDKTYLDYFLDAYRMSYGSAVDHIAFGINLSFLNGRVVYLRQTLDENNNAKVDSFIDDKAYGYSLDFGAVAKGQNLSYGIFIPNLISKIYREDYANESMQRRFLASIQYGEDRSFLTMGISRRFHFKGTNTFHIGMQQYIQMGTFRGEHYILPIRIGAHTDDKIWKLKELKYGFGTGIEYGYMTLDVSINTNDSRWHNYYFISSISFGL